MAPTNMASKENIIKQRELIRKTILGMDRPFARLDIFHRVAKLHGIQNRALVLDVMDELFDSEAITTYLDIDNDRWVFSVPNQIQRGLSIE
jgi:hypothetical protein